MKRLSYLIYLVVVVIIQIEPPPSIASGSVKVAAIFPKTSKIAMESELQLNGIRYAIEELNQNGGLLGRKIELYEFDNQGTVIGSKIAAQKAVEVGVITVFGANWSSFSLAMAPVLQEANIPMISNISTNPQVTLIGDYIFRVCYIDPFQGRVLANFAIQDLKALKAGVLVNVDDQYSEGLAEFFINSFKKQGGKIIFVEQYLEKTSDFTSFFEKIKQYQPEVVFHPGHTKMSAFVLKQARESGITTIFLGGDGWNDSMYEIAGSSIEGSYYTTHWHQNSTNEKSITFVEKYKSFSRQFDPATALAEDCVYLFADAAFRAQSFDPPKLRDAIAATKNFQGVTGTISFDGNGDPIKSAVILKFENGTSVYVKNVEP
jgi:branched-chain amino acid transport system substrate-binding protein